MFVFNGSETKEHKWRNASLSICCQFGRSLSYRNGLSARKIGKKITMKPQACSWISFALSACLSVCHNFFYIFCVCNNHPSHVYYIIQNWIYLSSVHIRTGMAEIPFYFCRFIYTFKAIHAVCTIHNRKQ